MEKVGVLMGAKLNFCLLTDNNSKDILTKTISILFELGWRYNQFVHGEYSYWIDAPIWCMGESKTLKEEHLCLANQGTKFEDIIDELSQHYSPAITLGIEWFGKNSMAMLSICENEGEWKEVKFSFDRYDALDSLDMLLKDEAKIRLTEVFSKIMLEIEPYYGIGATEIMELVESPEKLKIDKETLGDLNYFSKKVVQEINLKEYDEYYIISENLNGGVLLTRKYRLLELD